jgi:hypothetical protein
MPEIQDIVRIRNIAVKPTNLPDVDSSEGLKAAAELVYRVVITKLTNNSPVRVQDGTKGRHWQGRIKPEIFYELWRELDDRMYVSKERSSEIIEAILGYLAKCKMLIRKSADTKYNPAVWWVGDHWTPMDVRSVEQEATQVFSEAAPQSEDGVQCRVCGQAFGSTNARGTHENRAHKVAVSADGVVYPYDDTFTEGYAGNIILRVLDDAGTGLKYNTVLNSSREIDPRMGKGHTERTLAALVETGRVRLTMEGMYPQYSLVPVEDAEDTKAPEPEPQVQVPAEPVQAPVLEPPAVDGNLATALAYVQDEMSAAIKGLIRASRGFNTVNEREAKLQQRVYDLERELATVKTKLVAKTTTAGPELETLRAQVTDLTTRLESTEAERDEYRDRLENFNRALKGLGVVK